MRIVDLDVTLFAWENLPNIRYGTTVRSGGSSTLGLVELRTDDGLIGHAFLGSSFNPRSAEVDGRSLVEILKPQLLGQDPLDRERIGRRMWQGIRQTTVRAIGAVDVALWDIAGKAAGMPVHKLIGAYRDSMPAYASSPVHDSVQAYCDEALMFREQGYRAYKIHPPHPWQRDVEICTAVRKAVGDDYPLMLDAAWGYDYPSAVRVGRAIQEMDFLWYEDPLAETDLYNYVKLKQHLHVPLMATELPMAGFDHYAPWIMARATDYLRGDAAFKGGITTMLKTAHLAEAFSMNYEIHHGSNSLNNVAGLHVAMAIRNCEYFEALKPEAGIHHGLVRDIEVDSQGLVHAPTGVGLGAEIDFDLVRRTTRHILR